MIDCNPAVKVSLPRPLKIGMMLSLLLAAASGAGAWDADVDTSFAAGGRLIFVWTGNSAARAIALQPDGMSVIAGADWAGATHGQNFGVARITPTGDFDTAFGGGDGIVSFPFFSEVDDYADDVVIQADGKIVLVGGYVSGPSLNMVVLRFHADGSYDNKVVIPYSGGGWAKGVALQPDGKIVVAGRAYYANSGADFAVARLNPDLTMDTTFSSDGMADWDFGYEGFDSAYGVAVREDGKIILGGTAYHDGQSVFGVMVYSASGVPQALGVARFSAAAYGEGLALQPDGKIVVSGRCSTNGGDFAIARFNDNGIHLDTTFDGDGMDTFSHSDTEQESALDVIVQHDGKIVATGFLHEGGDRQLALVRWNSDGTPDTGFNSSPWDHYTFTNFCAGHNSQGNALIQQSDHKIVVAGASKCTNADPAVAARFKGDETVIFFGGFESSDTNGWSSVVP
jgi:uncharacterized delta-60 repeat protein